MILLASMISVELGVTVATSARSCWASSPATSWASPPEWFTFLATFVSVVLNFLAGAEVDPDVLRTKDEVHQGELPDLVPGAVLFAWRLSEIVLGWETRPALIAAGIALSTTSIAVVYAVLVETGLNRAEIGKLIMAATLVTDLGTVLALTILFARPTRRGERFEADHRPDTDSRRAIPQAQRSSDYPPGTGAYRRRLEADPVDPPGVDPL